MPHVCDQPKKYHQQSLRNQNPNNAIQMRDSHWMQWCVNTWQTRNCGWVQRLEEISLFSFGFFSLTLYLYFRNCACHRPLAVSQRETHASRLRHFRITYYLTKTTGKLFQFQQETKPVAFKPQTIFIILGFIQNRLQWFALCIASRTIELQTVCLLLGW